MKSDTYKKIEPEVHKAIKKFNKFTDSIQRGDIKIMKINLNIFQGQLIEIEQILESALAEDNKEENET